MRSLYLIAFACFVALAIAQPATVLELISGNANFQVRYRANELPQWFLNGRVYYILGSLPCAFGEQPIWNGTDWFCGNFTGFPSGTSLFEQLNCLPGQNIAFNGTTYICSADSDLLAALNCPSGNIPVKMGSTFVCGVDSDRLAGLVCNQGDILISNGTAFNCAPATDRDTLRDLSCADGQTVKYLSGKWACANDLDSLSTLVCTAGQVAKFQDGTFICGTDNDYLANLGCVPGQTLVGSGPTTFRCSPEPRPPGVPISFIDGQGLAVSGNSGIDTYFGSPYERSFNPIQLANGFQAFALSFNFFPTPPVGFVFNVTLYRVSPTGSVSTAASVPYNPLPGTAATLASLNLNFAPDEQLYIEYVYSSQASGITVTTVLFVRHYVF